MKKVIGFCLAAFLVVGAQQTGVETYNIKKLPAGEVPTVDGTLTDWPEAYFVDSLKHQNNVFALDNPSWTRENFQVKLYMAHTVMLADIDGEMVDTGFVYFAVKVIADDVLKPATGIPNISNACDGDNIKVNPGGQAAAFYVFSSGQVMKNPSSPYTVGVTLFTAASLTGGENGRPAYECALNKAVADPFGGGTSFKTSIGSEDNDAAGCGNTTFIGVGVWNPTVPKSYNNNPWDNQTYYPNYILTATEGPSLASEKASVSAVSTVSISARPNPFTPSTTLSFTAKEAGSVKVFDAAGKMVMSQKVAAGRGSVKFSGAKLSSGVYVARIESGKNIANTKLFLTR